MLCALGTTKIILKKKNILTPSIPDLNFSHYHHQPNTISEGLVKKNEWAIREIKYNEGKCIGSEREVKMF